MSDDEHEDTDEEIEAMAQKIINGGYWPDAAAMLRRLMRRINDLERQLDYASEMIMGEDM